MRFSPLALAAVAVSLAAAPASASTKSGYLVAPPGYSAVNQYVENVPSAKGNVPTLTIHSHSHSGSAASGAVTPSTQQALAGQGTDGSRAATLANATAPPGVRGVNQHGVNRRHRKVRATGGSGAGGQGPGAPGTGSTAPTPVSGSVVSPTSAVLKAVTGSATHGLGALLPAILVASAIGAAMLAVLRRRQAT